MFKTEPLVPYTKPILPPVFPISSIAYPSQEATPYDFLFITFHLQSSNNYPSH